MHTRHQRAPMRPLPSPKIRLQYLIFPYADFRVGPLGSLDHFAIGGFTLWKDTPANWQQYLNCARPSRHLAMYVDREGNPVSSIWIATAADERRVESEEWQRLTAVLFYLAWALAYHSPLLVDLEQRTSTQIRLRFR